MPIEILHNETEVKNAIFETEQEIANKILFTSAPKNHGKNSIKENYPFPYYDSTYFSKVSQISQLKNKVQILKSHLEQLEEDQTEPLYNNDNTYNNTTQNTNNNNKYNMNYRVDNGLDIGNHNSFSNENYKIRIKNHKINKNKNNDLHLFVIIKNDTYPNKLADMESKLSQNSRNFTEKNFSYEDYIKEQIKSVDKDYAKRKDQLANFNNEMKNNLKDVHDKK